MSISDDEKIIYKRQLTMSGFSVEMQEKLKSSTVLVAGVGGLGGPAAQYLAAAGAGKLLLVHAGSLDLEDMNRQILMSSSCVGERRVTQALRRLKEINPYVEIETFDEWIGPDNIKPLVRSAQIVLDCRHNFKERRYINQACVEQGRVFVEGAMDHMSGYLTTIDPGKTPCLSCLFPVNQKWDPYGFSVLGAVSGIIGTLMALEAIKYLTGFGKPLFSTLLTFDGWSSEFRRLKGQRDPLCSVCGKKEEKQ